MYIDHIKRVREMYFFQRKEDQFKTSFKTVDWVFHLLISFTHMKLHMLNRMDISKIMEKYILSTLNLIRPSYTIKATIFEKVFRPENFSKTDFFPTKRIISLSSRTFKFSSRTCKLYFPL